LILNKSIPFLIGSMLALCDASLPKFWSKILKIKKNKSKKTDLKTSVETHTHTQSNKRCELE